MANQMEKILVGVLILIVSYVSISYITTGTISTPGDIGEGISQETYRVDYDVALGDVLADLQIRNVNLVQTGFSVFNVRELRIGDFCPLGTWRGQIEVTVQGPDGTTQQVQSNPNLELCRGDIKSFSTGNFVVDETGIYDITFRLYHSDGRLVHEETIEQNIRVTQ